MSNTDTSTVTAGDPTPSARPVRVVAGTQVPAAGDWTIDPAHTTVGFWVRHLGVTKVRGRFTQVAGVVRVGDDPLDSSVTVEIDAASVDTHEADRDAHLRSGDFLDVDQFSSITFRSTQVARRGTRWSIAGELTIRGVTRPVVLDTEFGGGAVDPWGEAHVMFTAETVIERDDFGLTWNQVLETGGVLVGKRITIELEISLVPAS